MKVGQGDGAGAQAASLIEQMQRAHADGLERADSPSKSFSLDRTQGASETSKAAPVEAPAVEKAVLGIAKRVVSGELKESVVARREVLTAMVEDRFGHMLPAKLKRQTLKTLEQSLAHDPQFAREVDEMLVLAAERLGEP